MLGFLFVVIKRPELESRTIREVATLYKKNVVLPSKPIWKPNPNAGECDLGNYDYVTDFKYGLSTLNYARWLAGFTNTVVGNKTYIKEQLACAINNKANGGLTHSPSPSSKCYTKGAANACGSSNLAMASWNSNSANDVLMYLDDSGVSSVGHRSWCLYQGLSQVTFGRVDHYGALKVMGFGYDDIERPAFFGWPGPGPFPSSLLSNRLVWSFHMKSFKSRQPQVEMFEDGNRIALDQSITKDVLDNYFRYDLIRFKPANGVKIGSEYKVRVTDDTDVYEYTVKTFDISTAETDPFTPYPSPEPEIYPIDGQQGSQANGGNSKTGVIVFATILSLGFVVVIAAVFVRIFKKKDDDSGKDVVFSNMI